MAPPTTVTIGVSLAAQRTRRQLSRFAAHSRLSGPTRLFPPSARPKVALAARPQRGRHAAHYRLYPPKNVFVVVSPASAVMTLAADAPFVDVLLTYVQRTKTVGTG